MTGHGCFWEDIALQRRVDAMKLKLSELNRTLDQAHLGGGAQRIAKEHAKGKLTARERIDLLLDEGQPPRSGRPRRPRHVCRTRRMPWRWVRRGHRPH